MYICKVLFLSCAILLIFLGFVFGQIKEDPLLLDNEFEGDIIGGISRKNIHRVTSAKAEKWPNGQIPFITSLELEGSGVLRKALFKAIRIIHAKTCVRFKAKNSSDINYIAFKKGWLGCASNVGMQGGEQEVRLGLNCANTGVILHLLMHVMGFWHESSRKDRDEYLLINKNNIQKEKLNNFHKYSPVKQSHYGEPFDYKSIMIMSPHAYAINLSIPTIYSRDERHKIGQRVSLSPGDINKIEMKYCGKEMPVVLIRTNQQSTQPKDIPRRPMTLLHVESKHTECRDQSVKCPLWATQGHCYKKEKLMKERCPDSCMMCPGERRKCKDFNALCGVWAWLRRCTQGNDVRKLSIVYPNIETLSVFYLVYSAPLLFITFARIEDCFPNNIIYCHEDFEIVFFKGSLIGVMDNSDGLRCRNIHPKCEEWSRKGKCFYSHIQRVCPQSCNSCDRFLVHS